MPKGIYKRKTVNVKKHARRPRVKPPERVALRKPKRLPVEENWWKRKNGDMILVRDMSHLHLMNAARMLLRQSSRYRAEHDNMVRSLIRFHGESSEFARLIARATNLSDFDFMARFHQNFRKLWSELVRRRLAWVVQEDMKHPDELVRPLSPQREDHLIYPERWED